MSFEHVRLKPPTGLIINGQVTSVQLILVLTYKYEYAMWDSHFKVENMYNNVRWCQLLGQIWAAGISPKELPLSCAREVLVSGSGPLHDHCGLLKQDLFK